MVYFEIGWRLPKSRLAFGDGKTTYPKERNISREKRRLIKSEGRRVRKRFASDAFDAKRNIAK